MSNKYIYVVSRARPACRCPSVVAKTLMLDITCKPLLPKFFRPFIFIATVDFFHFITSSVTLSLAGVTRSMKSKTCWLHILVLFHAELDEMWCGGEAVLVQHPDTISERSLLTQDK